MLIAKKKIYIYINIIFMIIMYTNNLKTVNIITKELTIKSESLLHKLLVFFVIYLLLFCLPLVSLILADSLFFKIKEQNP